MVVPKLVPDVFVTDVNARGGPPGEWLPKLNIAVPQSIVTFSLKTTTSTSLVPYTHATAGGVASQVTPTVTVELVTLLGASLKTTTWYWPGWTLQSDGFTV